MREWFIVEVEFVIVSFLRFIENLVGGEVIFAFLVWCALYVLLKVLIQVGVEFFVEIWGSANHYVRSIVGDLLQAKADEIIKKGCNPCETKWVAVGKVDINWVSDDEHVSISGYAQWVNFHLIANRSELEDKCMHLNYDDRLTFPYACDGGVISHKGGKIQTTLVMADGDNTFATDMIEGDLIICASNTLNPKDLYLRAYLGFSDHGQSVEVSLAHHISAIKARKPFKVTETVINEEIPSYNKMINQITYLYNHKNHYKTKTKTLKNLS